MSDSGNEELESKRKLRDYWYEVARDKTKEAGRAIRKANQIEKEVKELEKEKTKNENQRLGSYYSCDRFDGLDL